MRYGYGRTRRGMSRAGAFLAFIVLSIMLGALVNTAGLPAKAAGFGVFVIALLCWLGAGQRGSRRRSHSRRRSYRH